MLRTNIATKKSATAITAGTLLSVAYAWATHENLMGPVMMGIGAMVGLCTFVFYYTQEKTTK